MLTPICAKKVKNNLLKACKVKYNSLILYQRLSTKHEPINTNNTIDMENRVRLEQVGVIQEVAKAKQAFVNSGVRLCEQRNVIQRIQQTGGSFKDCLLEEARIWASELTDDNVKYWGDSGLPTQFRVSEAEYFFGWASDYLYGAHSWFKLMAEVWNA